jgi:hypothetical protein
MAPSLPGHDPDNPIRIFRNPNSPHGWCAQADQPFKPGPTALENPIYDRLRTPRPVSERGWKDDSISVWDAVHRLGDHISEQTDQTCETERQFLTSWVPKSSPTRGWVYRRTNITPSGKSFHLDRVALDRPEVDVTFENETRLHR